MAEEKEQAAKRSNKMILIGGIVFGVLLLEGVGIFLAVKLISKGPAEVVAEELASSEKKAGIDGHKEDQYAEVFITRLESPHTSTGRLYVISMTVYATVPKSLLETEHAEGGGHGGGDKESEVSGIEKLIQDNIATIKDRMRTVVASADASTLGLARAEKPDYGLVTLRRQFKAILDDVLGKDVVKDVLIADYMPNPLD